MEMRYNFCMKIPIYPSKLKNKKIFHKILSPRSSTSVDSSPLQNSKTPLFTNQLSLMKLQKTPLFTKDLSSLSIEARHRSGRRLEIVANLEVYCRHGSVLTCTGRRRWSGVEDEGRPWFINGGRANDEDDEVEKGRWWVWWVEKKVDGGWGRSSPAVAVAMAVGEKKVTGGWGRRSPPPLMEVAAD